MMFARPVLNIEKINSKLFNYVEELGEIKVSLYSDFYNWVLFVLIIKYALNLATKFLFCMVFALCLDNVTVCIVFNV